MGVLAIPFPEIDPVALWLGPLSVKWYGLAYMAGLLLGWLYVKYLLRQTRLWPGGKRPFPPDKADDLLLYMTIGVLVGGRLGNVIFYEPSYYLQNPLEIPAVWKGGMAFHGGLIGSIVAIVLFARRQRRRGLERSGLVRGGHADRPVLRTARQFHQRRAVGPPKRRALGVRVPRCRAHAAACKPALRGSARGPRSVRPAVVARAAQGWRCTSRASSPARSWLATAWRDRSASSSASPTSDVGPLSAGVLYSLPMVLAGIWMIRTALRRTAASAHVQPSG